MAMQDNPAVATDETNALISSDKVEGTAVYDRTGEKLGSIHSVMIDKVSGSKLEGAPTYGTAETPNWSDRRWGQQVHDYYGARPYWE